MLKQRAGEALVGIALSFVLGFYCTLLFPYLCVSPIVERDLSLSPQVCNLLGFPDPPLEISLQEFQEGCHPQTVELTKRAMGLLNSSGLTVVNETLWTRGNHSYLMQFGPRCQVKCLLDGVPFFKISMRSTFTKYLWELMLSCEKLNDHVRFLNNLADNLSVEVGLTLRCPRYSETALRLLQRYDLSFGDEQIQDDLERLCRTFGCTDGHYVFVGDKNQTEHPLNCARV
jgi:hypothetical protein